MSEAAEAPAVARPGESVPHPVDATDIRSAMFMGSLFVGTILVSLVLATALSTEVEPVFKDPESVANPIIYLVIVVVFTVLILIVAKLGFKRIIQYVILGSVFFTMAYVFQPLLSHYAPGLGSWSYVIGVGTAAGLTALLYYHPEWYVVDAAGVTVAAGATGLLGFSFGLAPAIVLLVALAVYDAIAVYRTKHMLDLADAVLNLRLPVMLIIPKVRGYSFLKGERIAKDDPKKERDALFMGLGDIVVPGVLVVSSYIFLAQRPATVATVAGIAPNLFVSLATLVGATLGFVVLMRAVLKGTPHPGLPLLNGGALVGFLSTTLWLYGWEPLVPRL